MSAQVAAGALVLAYAAFLGVLAILSDGFVEWWDRWKVARRPRLLPDCPDEDGDRDHDGVCPEAATCPWTHWDEVGGLRYVCPEHHPADAIHCDEWGWHCHEHAGECRGCAVIAAEDAAIDRADAIRKGEW